MLKVVSNYQPEPVVKMAKISGVYSITRKDKQKAHHYIGSSQDVIGRLRQHFSSLYKRIHYSTPMQLEYNLYGPTAFECRLLSQLKVPFLGMSMRNSLRLVESYWCMEIYPNSRPPFCGEIIGLVSEPPIKVQDVDPEGNIVLIEQREYVSASQINPEIVANDDMFNKTMKRAWERKHGKITF